MQAAAAAPSPAPKPRLWFLDNLKVLLTVLVVFHHAGQGYGPGGFWYYQNTERLPYLGTFFWVNASFFMGLFFFISAYFLPGTIDRKGVAHFLKDRFRRFGIPILLFVLLVNPMIMYVSYINFRGGDLPFWQYWTQIYLGMGPKPANFQGPSWPDVNFGHLWFLEHLLLYGVCYGAGRLIFKRPADNTPRKAPGDLAILGYALGLLAVTLVVRQSWPIDRWTAFLGFIQMEPAHLPQYASMFALGAIAARRNWVTTLPTATGMRWLWIGIAAMLYTAVVSVLIRSGSIDRSLTMPLYQLAEPFIATGMLVGLSTLFRERWNQSTPLWRTLSDNAFGAYLIHFPLVVVFNYATAGLPVGPFVKFLLVSAATTIASWLGAMLLRKLPGSGAVL